MVFYWFLQWFSWSRAQKHRKKPIKTMENHDQELRNIGTANKNQKTMIFKLWLEIKNSWFFIGFYDGFHGQELRNIVNNQ